MSGDCLLDMPSGRRINIKTDRKRWWPKTIYHTYWSRISYLVSKNAICFLIVSLILVSSGLYLLLLPSSSSRNYKKTELAFKLLKEKLTSNQDIFISPHQEKLISPPTLYPAADTYLDWDRIEPIHSNKSARIKAAFVAVVQESDLHKLRVTMTELDKRFDQPGYYPWIILSDKLLSKDFRYWIENSSKSPVFFGLIPSIEWNEPYWVDVQKVEKNIKDMVKDHRAPFDESMSWRKATRYTMGFIAHHPLLKDLEYYWKIQPGSEYGCNIVEDPFITMKNRGCKMSYGVTATENHLNLENFHETVAGFIIKNKGIILPPTQTIYKGLLNSETRFGQAKKDDLLGEYHGHFSNCMIKNTFSMFSLNYLRSKEYNVFFDYLDQTGGFFYNKWGDSMAQTLAAALFLNRTEICSDMMPGFVTEGVSSCPRDFATYSHLECTCDFNDYKARNSLNCASTIKNNPYSPFD